MNQQVSVSSRRFDYEFNTGGPRSRTRTQLLSASLLQTRGGSSGLPRIARAALDFGENDPLDVISDLLESEGYSDPEQLRGQFELPDEPYICRVSEALRPLRVDTAELDDVLGQVLLLSLSTPTFFDPQRPVLITRASMTRRIELFASRGYYA